MSTRKTQVDARIVLEFLRKKFDRNIISIDPLEGGEMSQAFSFNAGSGKFVIRVDTEIKAFEKDKFAFEHFASNKIPIPEVIRLGRLDQKYYYAITKKAEGQTLDKLSEKEARKILPQLIQALDEIHNVYIRDLKYGDWGADGDAWFNTWREYILSINNEKWFEWGDLFKNSFMEKEVFAKAYDKIEKIVEYCPEQRYLVHGDYGFNNLLADGEKITGVLDWGESKYGDFLYDVAWLGFWTRNIDYEKEFYKHYKEKNIDVPNYGERILCYKLYLGLSAAQFSVKSNQEKSYIWTRDRILSFLK